jgi:hypothetical protein
LLAGAVAVAGAVVACGEGPSSPRPILPTARFEVLVESPTFGPAGSAMGSRFGAGWVMAGTTERPLWSMPGSRSALEWINLGEETSRTLTLAVASPVTPGSWLWVRVGSRIVARVPISAKTVVNLPDDFPPGRIALSLTLEGPGPFTVQSVAVQPVLRPGSAHLETEELLESGNSLVSFGTRLKGREVLVGEFTPPPDASPGQRWQLEVDRLDGSPVRRFEWTPSLWNRLQGSRRIELPLRGERGMVRIRLLALSATNPAAIARWSLALAAPPDRDLPPGL